MWFRQSRTGRSGRSPVNVNSEDVREAVSEAGGEAISEAIREAISEAVSEAVSEAGGEAIEDRSEAIRVINEPLMSH